MTLLKQLRREKRLKQEEMAKLLDISISAYRNYEKGLRSMPLDVVYKFLTIRGYDSDLKLADMIKELL